MVYKSLHRLTVSPQNDRQDEELAMFKFVVDVQFCHTSGLTATLIASLRSRRSFENYEIGLHGPVLGKAYCCHVSHQLLHYL